MPPISLPARWPSRGSPGPGWHIGCAAAAVALAALPACGAHEQPVVGFGVGDWGEPNVRVVREELTSWERGPTPLIVFDSGSGSVAPDAEVARALVLAATPGLVAVVGHGGSRGSLAAAPVYNEAGIVQIVPSATSRLLDSAGEWTLAMAPSDSAEAEFIARFVQDVRAGARVTVFYESDEFGAGMREMLSRAAAARGLTVVADVPYSLRSDLEELVRLARRRGPADVLVIAGRWRQAMPLAAAGRRAYGPVPIVFADGVELEQYRVAPGAVLDDVYGVAFWHPSRDDSVSAAFVRRYERLNRKTPGAAQAMRHDALMAAATAVREAGPDRAAVFAWLRSLGHGRPAYRGVTGPVTFGRRSGPLLMIAVRSDSVVMEQH